MGWLLIVIVAVLAAAAAYLTSLRLHPWTPCRKCSGSGKSRDRLWRGAYGSCASCGGRGKHPRLGVRVLQRERARRLAPPTDHKKTDQRKN